MGKRFIFVILLVILPFILNAQIAGNNYYWVAFTDKNGTGYSLDLPEKFLSQRAIIRREKQKIEIDETDLPVSKIYTDSLKSIGFHLIHTSKWLNGCTVSGNQQMISQLSDISFIKEWEFTKPADISKSAWRKFEVPKQWQQAINLSYYGASFVQINQLNGLTLHQQGFRGKGIQIAVLDNGFLNTNGIAAFDSLWNSNRILGVRDFIDPGGNVFREGGHGTNVLSAMAACWSEQMVGTAPDASYYLLRTEDDASEYLIEEDNWVAGAEYADSLGVDIINSSLGYAFFDDPAMDHNYDDMDGQTTRVTRAANMAMQKGILVFNSAGNEGDDPWHYIIAPSDGDNVIAVGAVDADKNIAYFTSYGPASDGDVKPNVAAMGLNTALVGTSGDVMAGNGTSFSSPLLAGMAACLWQANPTVNSSEIKWAIEQSSSLFSSPNIRIGYGIPDFSLAMFLLANKHLPEKMKSADWHVFPNPADNYLQITWLHEELFEQCRVQLFSLQGTLFFDCIFSENSRIYLSNLANLPSGLFILNLISEEKNTTFKIVKL